MHKPDSAMKSRLLVMWLGTMLVVALLAVSALPALGQPREPIVVDYCAHDRKEQSRQGVIGVSLFTELPLRGLLGNLGIKEGRSI
jgi:hypothetical protein